MLDGCAKIIQICVFLFNFIVLLLGLGIAGVAIWTLVDDNYIHNLLDADMYVTAAGILVAMGTIMAVISFLGCCGALRENKCLLATYFAVVMLILILIIIGAVFAYITKDKIKNKAEEYMMKNLFEYDKSSIVTEAWDSAQKQLTCCGVNGWKDWDENWKFKNKDLRVPVSCCLDGTPACQINPIETNAYTMGCLTKVVEFIESHSVPLIAICISVIVIMVLSMISTCWLYMML